MVEIRKLVKGSAPQCLWTYKIHPACSTDMVKRH